MFPSGSFLRSPKLRAPRHPALLLSARLPLSPAVSVVKKKTQFKSAAATARWGLSLYNTPLARFSTTLATAKQLSAAQLVIPRRTFSTTALNMTGTKIDGTAIAKDIREKLRNEIADLQAKNPRFKPNLVIYQGV